MGSLPCCKPHDCDRVLDFGLAIQRQLGDRNVRRGSTRCTEMRPLHSGLLLLLRLLLYAVSPNIGPRRVQDVKRALISYENRARLERRRVLFPHDCSNNLETGAHIPHFTFPYSISRHFAFHLILKACCLKDSLLARTLTEDEAIGCENCFRLGG